MVSQILLRPAGMVSVFLVAVLFTAGYEGSGIPFRSRLRCRALRALLVVGVIAGSVNLHAAEIEITRVPPWGFGGSLTGRVSGVDFANYAVAAYIQIEGVGWWTKRSFANPTVPIGADGSFSVPVVTGGLDHLATLYTVELVPSGTIPPRAEGHFRVPANPLSVASASQHRYGRTIEWAGHVWAVKQAPQPVGPGANRFSSLGGDVFVDGQQNLHLTVNQHDANWHATEVFLTDQSRLGYGNYVTKTNARVARLDPFITLSPGFTWDQYGDEENGASPNREIDIEHSKWAMPVAGTSQFVVQPHQRPGNLVRFAVPANVPDDATLTHMVTWQNGRVDFRVLLGDQSPFGYEPGDVLAEHTYLQDPAVGHFVPTPGRATFRMNLWPNNVEVGQPGPPRPSDGQPVDVAIKSFDFFPMVYRTPPIKQGRLVINTGQTIAVNPNSGTSVVGTLFIAGTPSAPTATLDLTNNAAVINYVGASPVAAVREQLIAGRGGQGLGKRWNGMGITSSAAAAAEPESRSVGYAENAAMPLGPLATFRGQAVDDTSILMAFTRTGDANLDGLVNDDDVTIVGASYAPGVSQPHWALGDFDYNGFVDDDDVTLLGALYDPRAPALAPASTSSGHAAAIVPEPASLMLVAMGFAGLLVIANRAALRRRLSLGGLSAVFRFTCCFLGSVCMFPRFGHAQPTIITPPGGAANYASFGSSLTVMGDDILIAANRDSRDGPLAGSVYRFDVQSLEVGGRYPNPSPQSYDLFGDAIAFNPNVVAISSRQANLGPNLAGAGRVYMFDAVSGSLINSLQSPAPVAGGGFGSAIEMFGSHIAVSERGLNPVTNRFSTQIHIFNSETAAYSGAISDPALEGVVPAIAHTGGELFVSDGRNLFHMASEPGAVPMRVPLPRPLVQVADVVASNGHVLVAGFSSNSLTAFLFDATSGSFRSSYEATWGGDRPFTIAAALSGEHVALAGYDDELGTPFPQADRGEVFVFNRDNGRQINHISDPISDRWNGQFGNAVALSNNNIFVGARWAESGGIDTGHVFRFPVRERSRWNVDANGVWSAAGNWAPTIPNAIGDEVYFGSSISAPRVVALNSNAVIGALGFESNNAYTIAGAGTLSLDSAIGDAHVRIASGSHTISAPVSLADNTVITVHPAASLSITGVLNTNGHTLTKMEAGALRIRNVRDTALALIGGAVALESNSEPSVLNALSIAGSAGAPSAKLDVSNNAVIIDYNGLSPRLTIRQQIVAGRGGQGFGALWNGQGITSSEAAAANALEPDSRSVGFAENASMPLGPYTTFRGQPVDSTSVLIAFTRTGDANLDGVVNDDDVTIVGASYAPGVQKAQWALGDFDYNFFVDDDDITLLGAFYDPGAPALGSPDLAAGHHAAVPEPASLVLLAGACVTLLLFAPGVILSRRQTERALRTQ